MKRKKAPTGGAADFDAYFSQIYGDRWPGLKEALQKTADPENWIDGLVKPYYLDRASVIAASQLGVCPGDQVLDLCAAPGGKSLVLALGLQGQGSLTSNDRSADRRGRLKKVLQEHLPENFQTVVQVSGHDACRWGLYEQGIYDKILLDAPCSSERHVLTSPVHLAQWSPNRTKVLAQQALAMLCSALEALKPGGKLLYSTCSISPWENELLVERFEKKRPDQWIEVETDGPGEKKTKGRIILPDQEGGCGPMYYCLIQKHSVV